MKSDSNMDISYDELRKNHIMLWSVKGNVHNLKHSISIGDLKERGGQHE